MPDLPNIIAKLDIPTLRQLIAMCETRSHELQETGRKAAIERLTTEATALGYDTHEDLIGIRRRRPKTGDGSTQHEKERAL